MFVATQSRFQFHSSFSPESRPDADILRPRHSLQQHPPLSFRPERADVFSSRSLLRTSRPRSGGISLRSFRSLARQGFPWPLPDSLAAHYHFSPRVSVFPASSFAPISFITNTLHTVCVPLFSLASSFALVSFLINTLHTLCVALFLSWLSFSPSFSLLSTLYKLFCANRGVYGGC